MSVDKFYLALLAYNFLLCLLLVKVLADRRETGGASRDDIEAVDFLVTQADFLIEEEYVVLHIRVDSLHFADILFEFVATVIGPAKLLSPDVLLALIGAKLRAATRTSCIWIVVLSW